jgi:hypothetical protein
MKRNIEILSQNPFLLVEALLLAAISSMAVAVHRVSCSFDAFKRFIIAWTFIPENSRGKYDASPIATVNA